MVALTVIVSPMKNRTDKADAVVAIGEGDGIDLIGGHADADAQDERAMGDALFEFLGLDPFGIHVMGEEIAGLARV